MSLAWLTLIGAAIGVRQRSHFTLYVRCPSSASSRPTLDQSYQSSTDHRCRLSLRLVRLPALSAQSHIGDSWFEINLAWLYASAVVGGALIAVYGLSMIFAPPRRRIPARSSEALVMLLLTVALVFILLILLSMPIVFSLAVAGIAGLWLGGYPLQQLSSCTGLWLAKLGATGNSRLRICGKPDGALWHEPCACRAGARHGWLGARRPRHVGDRSRLFLLGHLRVEDGRGLRARLLPDATAHQGRL